MSSLDKSRGTAEGIDTSQALLRLSKQDKSVIDRLAKHKSEEVVELYSAFV